MRGEHHDTGHAHGGSGGSSPHARGAHRLHRAVVDARGIIPACAGSTVSPLWMGNSSRDHPRMRGEHFVQGYDDVAAEGSSPHARGARDKIIADIVAYGIIPACAGSTWTSTTRRKAKRDHPRMRGEHIRQFVSYGGFPGSSPHARGAPRAGAQAVQREGIIPACAGSTSPLSRAKTHSWDHPRMRGEHPQSARGCLGKAGSSPHARGAHRVLASVSGHHGIIPACAGSTSTQTIRWQMR